MKYFILIFLSTNIYALDFESGESKVSLVELYTSESCSSCPPAEKWIENFKESEDLFKKIVPVEFHVTYWNHLSWKDPFSKNEFSKRQREYNQRIRAGVYTPQVILNGSDLRAWRGKKSNQLSTDVKVGNLKASFDQTKSLVKILFNPASKYGNDLNCLAVLSDGGYSSKIPSGENSGKILAHEFVAKSLNESKMEKLASGEYSCELQISKTMLGERGAIAVWVADS